MWAAFTMTFPRRRAGPGQKRAAPMFRSITRWCVLGTAVVLAGAAAAAGQVPTPGSRGLRGADIDRGELHGTIRDDRGQPLYGAIVSALGLTQAFEISDREGRFSFRSLPAGRYLVRAHLPGYNPTRGSLVHVNGGTRHTWAVALSRSPVEGAPIVLAAGVGPRSSGEESPGVLRAGAGPTSEGGPSERDGSETAWRLRRLPRGVLKDGRFRGDDGQDEGPYGFARQAGAPPRLASEVFDFELNGQIDLLTTTSFDRPRDLFSIAGTPQPIAYLALMAPTPNGDWTVRGSVTQGDISSWILAGSFLRRRGATHRFEAGASYSTQQYQGGNVEALAAMSDGARNVGELHAQDVWTVTPQLTVVVGGRYASYEYLDDPMLLSGHASLGFRPSRHDPLTFRISTARREIAPGAEEFVPPAVGPWLPPERTFSPLGGVFRPEAINHVEFAGEGEVRGAVIVSVRAFRQRIDDQIITLFGLSSETGVPPLGHYHVATAGDFESYGWGVGVARHKGDIVQASLEYSQFEARARGAAAADEALARISPALLRREERIHDLTATFNSRVPATATRFLVVYKLNTAFADAEALAPMADARFEVQVTQELPFLDFTGARWEMLAGVRNLFRSELFDGSVYDELMVVRPPKRVVGGLTVRF
jgi:hypothetical protein